MFRILKKAVLGIGIILLLSIPYSSSGIGLTFSYFYPQGGYFSSPLMPVALKDAGVRFGKVFGLTGSLSLYSINGMKVKGLPFELERPVVGPFHSLVGTVTPQLIIPIKKFEIRISGGGFTYYNFNTNLIYGNLDRAIAEDQQLEAVNSEFDFENKLGFGFTYGGSITYFIVKKVVGITVGANYYRGSSKLDLKGEYVGANSSGDFVKKTVNYPDSKLDFRGVEVMLGVTILSGKSDTDSGGGVE